MNSSKAVKILQTTLQNENLLRYSVFGFLIIMVLLVGAWVYNKLTLRKNNCLSMDTLYKDFAKVHTINTSNDLYKHDLRDYYIKTAYNACSAGKFKNDFVDLCALKSCIKQGIRCLDFEIYSVDNKPVVATSSVDNYKVKETYNYVDFDAVLSTINNYAFSGGTCPNPGDPLIINLRIMSNNTQIYNIMATDFEKALSSKLLGPKYSYENHGKNIGQVPLKNLMGKVIVIADKSNPLFEKTPLDEYVNIASNSVFMRSLRFTDGVKYTPDINELIDYNKKHMSICLPDISVDNTNISASLAMKCGCQMVAMSTQNFDNNMQYYDLFFDEVGTSFVLRPEELRFIPLTVDAPTPPPAKYSYKEREIASDFYSFNI